MKLKWKYFVVEPRSKTKNDPFAIAAREAMRRYAETIRDTDPEFATEIIEWVDDESKREQELPEDVIGPIFDRDAPGCAPDHWGKRG